MRVAELGEFGLIDRLAGMVGGLRDEGKTSWKNLVIGIGDDTAAWRCDNELQLATVDCMVQDVHFSLAVSSWEDLGWKALAVNLSDIAAMGGSPRYVLVSLALPGNTDVDDVMSLYRGMLDMAERAGVAVVGGNVSSAPVVVVDVTVLGAASSKKGLLMTRSAARPGDKLAVTGYPGSAAAGLEMLTEGLRFDADTTAYLKNAFLRPQPRLAEGQMLVNEGVRAAIDISDGLLSDLRHICQTSGVGAKVEIEGLPLNPLTKAAFRDTGLEFALSGGEDYELLFTASPAVIKRAKNKMQMSVCPLTVIGEITEEAGKIVLLDKNGKTVEHGRTGWDHFGRIL